MLARAALGAIIKAAAKSAAKKVATKEVGKVAEKAVAKTATTASKATPKKSLSSSAAKEATTGEAKAGRKYAASARQEAKNHPTLENTKGKPATSAGRKLGDKPKAKASAAKKSLSSSAAKESKARGDGPSKGELKGWAREAKANRDAKTADHYEGPKEPATSSGRKLGDKVTSKPDTRLSKTTKPRNMKEMKERHEASGGTKRPLSAGQKDRHSNSNVANRDKFGTGRAKARKNINA